MILLLVPSRLVAHSILFRKRTLMTEHTEIPAQRNSMLTHAVPGGCSIDAKYLFVPINGCGLQLSCQDGRSRSSVNRI